MPSSLLPLAESRGITRSCLVSRVVGVARWRWDVLVVLGLLWGRLPVVTLVVPLLVGLLLVLTLTRVPIVVGVRVVMRHLLLLLIMQLQPVVLLVLIPVRRRRQALLMVVM